VITDQELLEGLQRLVIEPPDLGATWPSGLWTTDEILGYANQRQDRLLKESLVATSWLDMPFIAQQSQQNLPDGWLATRNAFTVIAGTARPLSPIARWEADLLLHTWQTSSGIPQWYISEEWATRQIALVPVPQVAGVLHLYAALVGQVLDRSGIALTIPDELAPYLEYGILADMLGKQGRAYDRPRSEYCEVRFAEGVALSRALLKAVVIS
jgi:hypothetical protein